MDKEHLLQLVNDNKSTREIGKVLNKSQATVKYWLKKYEIKTKHNQYNLLNPVVDNKKTCSRCNLTKELEEYEYNKGLHSICRTCRTKAELEKNRNLKKLFLDYKGSQCTQCGYNKCNAALEFHHLDPNEKEFELGGFNKSSVLKTGLTKEVKEELDKCTVLCANCHREVHFKLNSTN